MHSAPSVKEKLEAIAQRQQLKLKYTKTSINKKIHTPIVVVVYGGISYVNHRDNQWVPSYIDEPNVHRKLIHPSGLVLGCPSKMSEQEFQQLQNEVTPLLKSKLFAEDESLE
jgi:hypothetical protein